MSELPENSASVAQAFKPAKPSSRKPGKSASKSARSRAREFALQALYQVLVGKNEASDIDVFTRDLSGFHKADSAHYDALLYGCAEHASFVVQLVMVILMAISIASWAAIVRKLTAIKRIQTLNEEFEQQFWSGTSLNDLFAAAVQNSKLAGPMERIFASGMREYQKLRERRISDPGTLLDGARRAMRASFQREMDVAEAQLSFLASVGSVSPYVGLFGTVWGIMHAFTGLASMQQVTLATVAPGIAEALVATAIGLFAAIPAVVAFNRFARDIDRVAIKLETFIEEFSNILQRSLGGSAGSGGVNPASSGFSASGH